MSDLQFITLFLVVCVGFLGPIVTLVAWSIIKKRQRLTNKEAVIVWIALFAWYIPFLTQGQKLIPESWKPVATQQMVCEMKTVYVPRK